MESKTVREQFHEMVREKNTLKQKTRGVNKINEEDEFEDIEDNNCSIDDSDDEVEEINVNKNLNV